MTEIKQTEELKELIEESRELLANMKKTLKGMILVAIPVFVTFFYTFVDVRVELGSMISKVDAEAKYATKAAIIYFQNDIYDMNNASFSLNVNTTEEKMERMYTKALKEFNGDVSRSTTLD